MAPSDLALAIEAARGAGEIIRRAFRTPLHVEYKSADQPVTAADAGADAFLRRTLLAGGSSYGWISEESDTALGSSGTIWVVDPLDGTVNFIEGRPAFAVCIALLQVGEPVLGVVYNPITDELYTAENGSSTLNGHPISAGTWQTPPRLVVSWGEIERYRMAGLANEWRLVTVGSTALKLMEVAKGAAEAYVSSAPKKIWDVCAAGFIAQTAGATVRDLSGRSLNYSTESADVAGTIAVAKGGEPFIERLVALGRESDADR